MEISDLKLQVQCRQNSNCNCSKERVEKAVISVGKKEIQDMIDDGQDIEVKCHFCNTAYKYSVEELKDILKHCKR